MVNTIKFIQTTNNLLKYSYMMCFNRSGRSLLPKRMAHLPSCLCAAAVFHVTLVWAGPAPWFNRKQLPSLSYHFWLQNWEVHFLLDPWAELTCSRATVSASAGRRGGNAWLRGEEKVRVSVTAHSKMRYHVKANQNTTHSQSSWIHKYCIDTAAEVSWRWHLCFCTRIFNLL